MPRSVAAVPSPGAVARRAQVAAVGSWAAVGPARANEPASASARAGASTSVRRIGPFRGCRLGRRAPAGHRSSVGPAAAGGNGSFGASAATDGPVRCSAAPKGGSGGRLGTTARDASRRMRERPGSAPRCESPHQRPGAGRSGQPQGYHARRVSGEWPSGKAPDSGSGDRRFESFLASQRRSANRESVVRALECPSVVGAWLNGRAPDSGSGGSRFESWRASQALPPMSHPCPGVPRVGDLPASRSQAPERG